MRKLHEKDLKYTLGRFFVDTSVRGMFSEIRSEGKENVPTDGAVLLAPNHCNALMDALVILQDWKEPTLFGARADIFRKPSVKRILRFLRILPIPRARDGAREVARNLETMEEVVDCLSHGMRYCMFCEGTHRPMHSLLPLKKGIARTALLANERLGNLMPVYIVPVGLEYKDYYRSRTPVGIRYGEAINVTEFLKNHHGTGKARIYNLLLETLDGRLRTLFTCLPDDETYEGRWALTKIAGKEAAMSASPELLKKAEEFDKERKEARISSWSLAADHTLPRALRKSLAALVISPIVLFAAVVSSPMWLLSARMVNRLKDKAFTQTARFGVKFAMTPLLVIVWALVFFLCLPFKAAVVAFILALFSHIIFYESIERGRVLLSDIRSLWHKDLKDKMNQISQT